MSTRLERPATQDRLFLWVMHRFAEVFEDHAILKGGMALRLIDSPRSTTEIDYVFVPYASKKDIHGMVEAVLREIEDAEVVMGMHSKMLRAELRVDDAAIQIEVNVAMECHAGPMSTGGFAERLGEPPRVVRIMESDWALAHKLAAWNERRLLRDLYDCTFFVARLNVMPAPEPLDRRLREVRSRLPGLKKVSTMTRSDLAEALREQLGELTPKALEAELGGLLPPEELAGLAPRITAAVFRLVEWLEG